MGVSQEGMQLMRAMNEARFEIEGLEGRSWGQRVGRDLQRLALGTVVPAWSYLLMLIVMNFNVGVFLAAVFGMGCGSVGWGSVRRNAGGMGGVRLSEGTVAGVGDGKSDATCM